MDFSINILFIFFYAMFLQYLFVQLHKRLISRRIFLLSKAYFMSIFFNIELARGGNDNSNCNLHKNNFQFRN